MGDDSVYIQVDGTEGRSLAGSVTGDDWARERAGRGSGTPVLLRPADDDDVEGHVSGTSIKLRAFDDESDTEGHAISIDFPSREAADAFRRRLMLAGVLTGTLALGAVAGAGLGSLTSSSEGSSTVPGAGMEWSQAERPDAAQAGSGATGAGMDWSQAERPGTALDEQQPSDDHVRTRQPTPE